MCLNTVLYFHAPVKISIFRIFKRAWKQFFFIINYIILKYRSAYQYKLYFFIFFWLKYIIYVFYDTFIFHYYSLINERFLRIKTPFFCFKFAYYKTVYHHQYTNNKQISWSIITQNIYKKKYTMSQNNQWATRKQI